MLQKDFIILKQEVDKDLHISEDNVLMKSIELPKLHSKYLDKFMDELNIYKKMKHELDKLYHSKYHHYKYEGKYQLDNQKEIDIYVKGDDEYYKLSLETDYEETIMKYLEKIVDLIKNLGYNIKNYIDYKKWINGC